MAGAASNLVDARMRRPEGPDVSGLAPALPGRIVKFGPIRVDLRSRRRGSGKEHSQANARRHASPRD